MSEQRTTTNLDDDTIAEIDAIAEALIPLHGGKRPKRAAIVRRAVHDLFLSVCPVNKPIELPVDQPV